jgi:hypothetical protein
VEYDLLVVSENGSDTLTGDYNLVLNKLTNKRPVNALYVAQDAQYSSKWHYHRVVTFETTDSSIIIAFDYDVLIWFPDGTHAWD